MSPHRSASLNSDCTVLETLREMPAYLRAPFVMRRMGHASTRDIAEALVISPGLVERQIAQAYRIVVRRLVQLGVTREDVDRLIDARLEPLPVEEFVGRVMDAVRQMPPPSDKLTASDVAERLTHAIVTVVVAATGIGAAIEVLRSISGS